MMTSSQERHEIIDTLSRLLQEREAIQFAYLHGSFLDEIPFHDIDIGVYLEGLSPLAMEMFAVDLSDHLSRQIGCPVDARALNNAPVSFVFQVLRGKLLVDRNSDLHGRIFEQTVCRYLDLKPLLLRATKEAFAGA